MNRLPIAARLLALTLIQSTDRTITRIAETRNYLCQARFAERFQKRFGYWPPTVR